MTFEFAMCNQRGGGTSVLGNDQVASQKVEFRTQTSNRFVINKEHQGDIEQHRYEESIVQPTKEVSDDADARKYNLEKLLENKFVMIDLGTGKKIVRMEIRRGRRAGELYISHYIDKVLQSFYFD